MLEQVSRLRLFDFRNPRCPRSIIDSQRHFHFPRIFHFQPLHPLALPAFVRREEISQSPRPKISKSNSRGEHRDLFANFLLCFHVALHPSYPFEQLCRSHDEHVCKFVSRESRMFTKVLIIDQIIMAASKRAFRKDFCLK